MAKFSCVSFPWYYLLCSSVILCSQGNNFFPSFCHSQLLMGSHLQDTEPHLPDMMFCLLDMELGCMDPLLLYMELPLWATESCLLDMKPLLWSTESHLPDMESHLPDTESHLPHTELQLWCLVLHLPDMKPHLWVMRLCHLLSWKQGIPFLRQPRLLDSRHLFPLPHLHKLILPPSKM